MIIDYAQMKELEDKIGGSGVSSPHSVPDLLNVIINDVLEDCEKINIILNDANVLKADYKETTEKRQEDSIVIELTELNNQANRLFTKQNKAIQVIRDEVNEQKSLLQDPTDIDPELMIKDTLSKSLQKKVYDLIKVSQKNQLEIRVVIQKKIAKQMRLYNQSVSEEQIQQYIQDPEKVQEMISEARLKGTNKKIQDAVNEIKEKLIEIRLLEQNVNYLCQMIDDLSLIVRAQSEMVNSIEQNLAGITDFIVKMNENFEKAQTEYNAAQKKFWGIFVVMLIIMIFGIQYAMGKLGIIQLSYQIFCLQQISQCIQ